MRGKETLSCCLSLLWHLFEMIIFIPWQIWENVSICLFCLHNVVSILKLAHNAQRFISNVFSLFVKTPNTGIYVFTWYIHIYINFGRWPCNTNFLWILPCWYPNIASRHFSGSKTGQGMWFEVFYKWDTFVIQTTTFEQNLKQSSGEWSHIFNSNLCRSCTNQSKHIKCNSPKAQIRLQLMTTSVV